MSSRRKGWSPTPGSVATSSSPACGRSQARYPSIGDARGLGLMVALELVKPGVGDGRTPDPELTKRIQAEALARKLIVLTAGTYVNVVRIIPPLVTTADEVDQALGDPRRVAGGRRSAADAVPMDERTAAGPDDAAGRRPARGPRRSSIRRRGSSSTSWSSRARTPIRVARRASEGRAAAETAGRGALLDEAVGGRTRSDQRTFATGRLLRAPGRRRTWRSRSAESTIEWPRQPRSRKPSRRAVVEDLVDPRDCPT